MIHWLDSIRCMSSRKIERIKKRQFQSSIHTSHNTIEKRPIRGKPASSQTFWQTHTFKKCTQISNWYAAMRTHISCRVCVSSGCQESRIRKFNTTWQIGTNDQLCPVLCLVTILKKLSHPVTSEKRARAQKHTNSQTQYPNNETHFMKTVHHVKLARENSNIQYI